MSTTTVRSSGDATGAERGRHGAALWVLLGLFGFRVAAQLAVAITPLPLLPPFESWHSGLLPYPALVVAQFVILAVCARMARGIGSGRTTPRPALGTRLYVAGGLYFAFMTARLVLGLTLLTDSAWWHAPIPSVFHLVLASFLLVAGHYHARRP